MAKLFSLARMLTPTTGTGTVTLSTTKTGYLSFASAGVSDGDIIAYAITDGANSEIGYGVYTASGTTLTRNVRRSTNSNSAISLSGSAEIAITPAAEDLLSIASPGGRLTLATGTPVMSSSVAGITTVYFAPYRHRFCPLYDGSSFTLTDLGGELLQTTSDSTKSPAACTTNSNYDLFVWNDSGTYRCTRGPAWTSDTARGTGAGTTELERVQGILVNKVAITNGPAANRGTYVGTIRTNGSSQVDFILGGLATGGSAASLGVWNAYNRVETAVQVFNSTLSWTYTSNPSVWRAQNASNAMRVSFVSGLQEDAFSARNTCISTSTVTNQLSGVGFDSTSTPSGIIAAVGLPSGGIGTTAVAEYTAKTLGWHFCQSLERNQAAGSTATFYGYNDGITQSGLSFTFPM